MWKVRLVLKKKVLQHHLLTTEAINGKHLSDDLPGILQNMNLPRKKVDTLVTLNSSLLASLPRLPRPSNFQHAWFDPQTFNTPGGPSRKRCSPLRAAKSSNLASTERSTKPPGRASWEFPNVGAILTITNPMKVVVYKYVPKIGRTDWGVRRTQYSRCDVYLCKYTYLYMQYDWELYTEACGYLYVVPQSHEYSNQFYQSF